MSSPDIAAWAAVAVTLLAAFGALYAVWWQVRRQWFLHSATLVSSFLDRYMSEEWRRYRLNSATCLTKYLNGEPITTSDIPVLNFFENMGHLVRRKAIDKEMVWNQFAWYIVRYYFALTRPPNIIERDRSANREWNLWEEFEWLAQEMLKIYQSKGMYTDGIIDVETRTRELIEEESAVLRFSEINSVPSLTVHKDTR